MHTQLEPLLVLIAIGACYFGYIQFKKQLVVGEKHLVDGISQLLVFNTRTIRLKGQAALHGVH